MTPTASQQDPKHEASVKALLDRCIEDARGQSARLERDRQDLRNLLLYRGGIDNHWSIYDRSTDRFVPRPTDGAAGIPEWFPRRATNKFALKIDGIVALLNQSMPGLQFVPQTDDDEDRATAKVAEDAVPALLEEVNYDRLKRRINQLVTLTDKVAVVYYFDNDEKYGTESVELFRCVNPECDHVMTPMEAVGGEAAAMGRPSDDAAPDQDQPRCPQCGGASLTVDVDPMTGAPQSVTYPRGKMCAALHSSFEFSLPSTAVVADAEENPWILTHQELAVEDACRQWPEHAEHIRHSAGRSGRAGGLARQFAETMRTLSGPSTAGQRTSKSANTVTVYRLQHDPLDDPAIGQFPKGLMAVQIGDVVVESGPLPVVDHNARPYKSVLVRLFADVPQAPFGKPPADDLGPLQEARNVFESLIELICRHDAAPSMWIPAGLTLEDQPTGAPGFIGRYRALTPGDKPTVLPGQNPPEALFKRLEQIDQDMEEISRLNSVLSGARPDGDPTLGEVQILQERGMASFRTPLDHLIDFEKRQARLLLDLARQTAWAPRFRKVEGENGQWNVSQFAAGDLTGAVDITVEALSAWPKSPTMEMVKVSKAVEMGLVVPAQDPEVSFKVLSMMNMGHLKPSLDVDRQQVVRELDRWKAATHPAQITPPPAPPLIAPQLHLWLKANFLRSEEAEQLAQANPAVHAAMVQHVQQLQMLVTPPASPTGPDGSSVEAAVQSGALVPVGAQAPNQTLDQAVSGGVLQPAAAAMPAPGPSIDDLTQAAVLTPLVPMPAAGRSAPRVPMGDTSIGGLR